MKYIPVVMLAIYDLSDDTALFALSATNRIGIACHKIHDLPNICTGFGSSRVFRLLGLILRSFS